jgi:hypothetical protein
MKPSQFHALTENLPELEVRLRQLRQRVFDHDEGTPEYDAIQSEIGEVKAELLKSRTSGGGARGPFSGLSRGELAASGTSEPDWY